MPGHSESRPSPGRLSLSGLVWPQGERGPAGRPGGGDVGRGTGLPCVPRLASHQVGEP